MANGIRLSILSVEEIGKQLNKCDLQNVIRTRVPHVETAMPFLEHSLILYISLPGDSYALASLHAACYGSGICRYSPCTRH